MNDEAYGRYLLSKRTVDDRALNRAVVDRLRSELSLLPQAAPRVVEIGAGLGTMVARLLDWQVVARGEYVLVDVNSTLLAGARAWLASWAGTRGLAVQTSGDSLRLRGASAVDLTVRFVCTELGELLASPARDPAADLLVANAFLDLVDVPALLPGVLRLLAANALYWFSLNFDGETTFEPGHPDDEAFLRVYHRSMDERVRHDRRAGDSRCGRHLFGHLRAAGASILAAGASDWVVHAGPTGYPGEEAQFLGHIIDTIGTELGRHAEISLETLATWLALRRQQIARGELVYIAHQLDFVGRRSA